MFTTEQITNSVGARKVSQAGSRVSTIGETTSRCAATAGKINWYAPKTNAHTFFSTPNVSAGQSNDPPLSGDHRGLDTHTERAHSISPINVRHGNELLSERGAYTIQRTELPSLPLFDGKVEDNGNAFDRWTRKLLRYAELQHWSERDTLLQFKLHLTGRAEELYDVLPEAVKRQSESEISALGERLRPIRWDAHS